eukprot:CAMPEP_0119410920 /NCGR_PEP_ID=MMETSP1335-20130426/3809_1 /TAXON_ID=259385 /ORGANISM="Chrysoculter rhomboideus, Strain RCC1486" /LENGTH=126 /DNA_ID=CAMNT_0007435521 /DNA_START=68 /DNA_END=448 /DNA_ORIENTATION=-
MSSTSKLALPLGAQLALGAFLAIGLIAVVAWALKRQQRRRRRDPALPVPYGVVRPMSPFLASRPTLQLKSVVVTGFDSPTPLGSMRSSDYASSRPSVPDGSAGAMCEAATEPIGEIGSAAFEHADT